MYTCLSSRATDIKLVHYRNTDSLIINLRRFIGRRGNVRMIRSDNGSKLISASTELLRVFQEMDYIKMDNFLEENSGEWKAWKRNL